MKAFIVTIGLFLASLLTACGNTPAVVIVTGDAPQISAYDMTATALCVVQTDAASRVLWGYQVFGTPTPDPRVTPTPTPLYVTTERGDAAQGSILFHGAGECALCHSVDSEELIVGPSLQFIGDRAAYMRPELTSKEYLTGVILYPNEFIVTRGLAGIMPTTYKQKFTAQEVADIVAYLMSLKG
jgi:mono/diheme cytochrome c family protein